MKRGTKRKLARMAGVTETHISLIFSGKRRPSWELAKRLGHITGTEPLSWLDDPIEEVRREVEKNQDAFLDLTQKRKILIHDRACDLVTGKGDKCSCMRNNPYLTEKARKKLEERGFFDKLYLEDIKR